MLSVNQSSDIYGFFSAMKGLSGSCRGTRTAPADQSQSIVSISVRDSGLKHKNAHSRVLFQRWAINAEGHIDAHPDTQLRVELRNLEDVQFEQKILILKIVSIIKIVLKISNVDPNSYKHVQISYLFKFVQFNLH